MATPTATILASCLMLASQTYQVPPAVLVGIYKAEGGRIGLESPNDNGTYDLGPMQINTAWLPDLADKWRVSERTARKWVRDDACTNVGVAAWILRGHMMETRDLARAIAYYHSRTPLHGEKYKRTVISILRRDGLIKAER